MCGIVGTFGKLPSRITFIGANNSMNHRGPDDSSIFFDDKKGIALGHKRLSIIDLSQSGHQPFFDKKKRFCLIFNGEIYNYKELRQRLADFYVFKTKTDTEVLLASYLKWGKECLEELQGMFAFAIWDSKQESLFVVRDRLGIKPLYYFYDDQRFIFASEIKAILEFPKVPRALNRESLIDYLSYRYALGEKTFFDKIQSLKPGHFVDIQKNKKPNFKKYWDLPVIEKKEDPGEEVVLEKIEKMLIDTVDKHMMSDVPVGAYLSGGLDSSLLVALMSKISNKKLKTFSIGFSEEDYNEFKYAQEVAQKFATDHKEIVLLGGNFVDLIPEVIKFKDEPLSIPNEIAVHILSKELKKHISVVMSGEGADELFGGYGKIFRSGDDFEKLEQLDSFSRVDKNKFLKNFKLQYGNISKSPIDHFLKQYNYIELKTKKCLLNKELFSLNNDTLINKLYFESFFKRISKLSVSEQYMYIFQKIHLLAPLRRLDATTMSKSVEARVPLVDHKFVEYISSLPLKYKLTWRNNNDREKLKNLTSNQVSEVYDITKYALRKISEKYLPKSITSRKKVGFPVPLNDWFAKKHNKMAKDLLLSDCAKTSQLFNREYIESMLEGKEKNEKYFGYNIWMLVNVEIWMKEYNVSI